MRLLNDPQFISNYTKHCKHLKLNGLQPKTIDAYSRAIRRIGNYFNCRLNDLTMDQPVDYFTDLLESHSWNTVKLDLYCLRFFYTKVLNKTWQDIPLIKPPKATRIPDIVSIEQAKQIFAATNKLSYKVFFFTLYSMGLRLGEGIRLTVAGIDLIELQKILGHVSLLTTARYTQLTTENRSNSYNKINTLINSFDIRRRGVK